MDNMGSPVAAPKVDVILQNIGDGAAHQVRASGELLKKDHPWIAEPERQPAGYHLPLYAPIPVLRTGDSIYVVAEAESFEVWDNASIEIRWWPPPPGRRRTGW
jgi:hypothetical protein